MDTDTLIEKVILVIQDPSFDEDVILGFLNKGLRELSGVIDFPELRVFDTVSTTTEKFVAMPTDYQKKCFNVVAVANEWRVDRPGELYQYHKFINRHPVSEAGSSVSDVTINGRTLFYNPIPDTAEALRLEYLRYPVDLVAGGGAPEAIPTHLYESLLVPFAAKEIFNLIEDGIEGPKVNYHVNEGLFRLALSELHLFLGFMDSEPNYISDDFL